MKYRERIPVAFIALLLLTVAVTPALATEASDDDGCQGFTTALSKVTNERARTAIQASLDARGCGDDGQTAQAACESLPGSYVDSPLAFGSNLAGVVDWRCGFTSTADLTVDSASSFLSQFCASGSTLIHRLADGNKVFFDCLL